MGRIEAERVYNKFKAYLGKREMKFETFDNDLVIKITVRGQDLPQPTIIRVLADRDIVQIVSPTPYNTPEDKRQDAAVAAAVANYGLTNGSFDFDIRDGEVRYRITHYYGDTEMTENQVEYLLNCIWFTTDRYNEKFFMLGMGRMTVQEFIEADK